MTKFKDVGRRTAIGYLATAGVALLSRETSASPAVSGRICLDLSADFDSGLAAMIEGTFDANIKKLIGQVQRYARRYGTTAEVSELNSFLKDLEAAAPSFLSAGGVARGRLASIWKGATPEQQAWFDAALTGRIRVRKGSLLAQVKASERIQFYSSKVVSKGYLRAGVDVPRELEALGYSPGKITIPVRAGTSHYAELRETPGGDVRAKVEAGARVYIAMFDPSKAWAKIRFTDGRGRLQWGWVASRVFGLTSPF